MAQVIDIQRIEPGTIIMWGGSTTDVPTGWILCNGNNGTPNVGYGLIKCDTHGRSGNTAGGTGSSSVGHSHAAGFSGYDSLSIAKTQSHYHNWTGNNGTGDPRGGGDSTNESRGAPRITALKDSGGGSTHGHSVAVTNTSNHTHTITPESMRMLFIMKV